MKYRQNSLLIGAFLATAAFAGTATADVAPPEDYVESCTLEKQQKPGEDCVECSATYFDNPNPCEAQYANRGYAHRCSSWGTAHTEIWCKAAAQGTAGSAGAADIGNGTAGSEAIDSGGQGGQSSAKPAPGSGGDSATGGAASDVADPMPSGGTPPTRGTSSTGGGSQTSPETNTGGTSTPPSGSTGGASASPEEKDDGGCSLAAPHGTPSGVLPGLAVALGLLGVRRRVRRRHR